MSVLGLGLEMGPRLSAFRSHLGKPLERTPATRLPRGGDKGSATFSRRVSRPEASLLRERLK